MRPRWLRRNWPYHHLIDFTPRNRGACSLPHFRRDLSRLALVAFCVDLRHIRPRMAQHVLRGLKPIFRPHFGPNEVP